MNNLEVICNGIPYSGWKTVSIQKSIDKLAGLFHVSTTEGLMNKFENWHLRNGDFCQLKIDDQIILTGYVDEITHSYDANEHRIDLKGRDITCDLIDCCFFPEDIDLSKVNETTAYNEWTNQNAKEIITVICDIFGIPVEVEESAQEAATEPIVIFKIKEGETAYESINRICKAKGILAITKGDRILRLTRAGSEFCRDDLVLGSNILSGSLIQSDRDRFSKYIIKGKGKSESKYLLLLEENPYAIVSDEIVGKKLNMQEDRSEASYRYRPKVLLTDIIGNFTIIPDLKKIKESGTYTDRSQTAIKICAQRGEQEARVRAGKSRRLVYKVQGWTQLGDGKVWEINKLVAVNDDLLGIEDHFLIYDIKFEFNETNGTTTELSLVYPEAYEIVQKPIKEIKTKSDELLSIEEWNKHASSALGKEYTFGNK